MRKGVGDTGLSFWKEDELGVRKGMMGGMGVEYMEGMGMKNRELLMGEDLEKEDGEVDIGLKGIEKKGNRIWEREEGVGSRGMWKELRLK